MDLPKREPQKEYRIAVLHEETQELVTVKYIKKQDEFDEDFFWEIQGRGLKP